MNCSLDCAPVPLQGGNRGGISAPPANEALNLRGGWCHKQSKGACPHQGLGSEVGKHCVTVETREAKKGETLPISLGGSQGDWKGEERSREHVREEAGGSPRSSLAAVRPLCHGPPHTSLRAPL